GQPVTSRHLRDKPHFSNEKKKIERLSPFLRPTFFDQGGGRKATKCGGGVEVIASELICGFEIGMGVGQTFRIKIAQRFVQTDGVEQTLWKARRIAFVSSVVS